MTCTSGHGQRACARSQGRAPVRGTARREARCGCGASSFVARRHEPQRQPQAPSQQEGGRLRGGAGKEAMGARHTFVCRLRRARHDHVEVPQVVLVGSRIDAWRCRAEGAGTGALAVSGRSHRTAPSTRGLEPAVWARPARAPGSVSRRCVSLTMRRGSRFWSVEALMVGALSASRPAVAGAAASWRKAA